MRRVYADIGGSPAILEVAETLEEQAIGFMFRESVGDNEGILFAYKEDHDTGFWMKNVRIPLSIAFLDSDMRIVEVLDMEPGDLTTRSPSRPYRYAVEMRQGWFDRNCSTIECTINL